MAVAPLTVNFRRAEHVSFTKPFLSLGISIMFRRPSGRQPDLFSFLNPLSIDIWLWIGAAVLCVTVGMYCIARLTPYEWNPAPLAADDEEDEREDEEESDGLQQHHVIHKTSLSTADILTYFFNRTKPDVEEVESTPLQLANNYSFFNTLWYVMSTLLKGGCDFGPRAVSTRLLGGAWWMFTLVITSAYTANLAAVLTVDQHYVPIKSLEDLANQTEIEYGAIEGGSTMQFFKESKIKAHMRMWERMSQSLGASSTGVFVKSNKDGVSRVLSSNYAYLMESTSLEYELQQNCNLTQIGGVLGSKGYGIALRKNSEWTDLLSRQILDYAEKGIIEVMKTKWWSVRGANCKSGSSAVKQQRLSLNMHNVAGLFVVLAAGLLLAVASVALEFWLRSRRNAKLDKRSLCSEMGRGLKFALLLNKTATEKPRQRYRTVPPAVQDNARKTSVPPPAELQQHKRRRVRQRHMLLAAAPALISARTLAGYVPNATHRPVK